MNHNILRILFIVILSNIINPPGVCQTEMPDVLKTGKLTEQLNYIEERTRIYEYYRAVREDMWQQIKKNTLDTLALAKGEISILTLSENKYNTRIDSLNKLVTNARAKMDEAVRTKNNIKVLGIDVNKVAYNSVMWIILASLAAILAIGFLVFKRNIALTRNTKKDLEELRTEFETYRKQSREAREKMSMEHFNELRKLRAHMSSGASAKEEVQEPEPESFEPKAKSAETKVQSSELSVEGELQPGQTEQELQSLSESLEPPGDEVPKLQSETKKPRKKRAQSPGQGSIELGGLSDEPKPPLLGGDGGG